MPDIIDDNNENRGDYDPIDHFEDFEDLEYDDFHRNLTELQYGNISSIVKKARRTKQFRSLHLISMEVPLSSELVLR